MRFGRWYFQIHWWMPERYMHEFSVCRWRVCGSRQTVGMPDTFREVWAFDILWIGGFRVCLQQLW